MKRIWRVLTLALFGWVIAHNPASAQSNLETNSLFYHSIRTPQINALNPALFPTNNSFYLSLPRASVNLNSPLSLKNVLTYNPGDTVTYIDVNNVLNQLSDNNKFRIGAEADIIGLGMKFGYTFVTLSSKIKVDAALGIPVDAINFITQGNIDANGNPISNIDVVNGDILKAQAYSEIALGVGHKIKSIGLTVGAKAKLLNGFINATTTDTKVSLNTDGTLDNMNASAYYKVKVSSILDWDTTGGSIEPILPASPMEFIPENMGWAFDIGAQYQLGPVALSASILNISKGIHWKQNVYEIAPENEAHFHFDGVDINGNDLLNGNEITLDTLSNYFQQQLDSLNPQFTHSTDYWHSVPTRINVGASINALKLFRFGILFQGQFDRGLFTTKQAIDHDYQAFRFNTTLSATFNLYNWLELTIASGITSDSRKVSFFNPGLSLSITPFTAIQIYAALDYVSNLYLVDIKSFNFMVGANILIGRGGHKKL